MRALFICYYLFVVVVVVIALPCRYIILLYERSYTST